MTLVNADHAGSFLSTRERSGVFRECGKETQGPKRRMGEELRYKDFENPRFCRYELWLMFISLTWEHSEVVDPFNQEESTHVSAGTNCTFTPWTVRQKDSSLRPFAA
jgi:hypothetical protein